MSAETDWNARERGARSAAIGNTARITRGPRMCGLLKFFWNRALS